ncbi:hypothetical protein Skr01_31000 [Sphaerisporangium krabiense]|uniref:Putative dithiol-disulfide oxidoreductase (DUF899 family) n=1 Tax=Sphaerisporangium krabiense TaxID=763782 RepID=A0A7W8Z1D7_9ACTN|nr:DUF899 domain-containing protein [Sphaerisporangium krabiense]MBB5625649.1 putative dithiol-disulfide oxidoreductase (DUF899 family) [Sphaerisporangium krabiense]GII63015.1 hypothetical protein Skr01_31000 [Sphaerisporangium krabiense]
MNRPPVVSAREWQAARDSLLVKEKELTHALDALAAERRRLPMVRLRTDYVFTAPDGATAGLTDLFEGRRQLVIYHFMLSPGHSHVCTGCASFTDNLTDRSHINARDTTLILMSPAPQQEIDVVRRRFGWTMPWYSAYGNDFYSDLDLGGIFGLSVLLRDGDEVFRTYYTTARGVDRLRLDFNLLDLTPYGRQEQWEDSPAGWPQDPTMSWLRPRDEY